MRKNTIVLAALAATAIAGCGSSSKSTTTSPAPASGAGAPAAAVTSPGAKVWFTSPKNGSKTASAVTFKVALSKFRIDPQSVGQAPRPGVGHLHFQMDGGKFDFPKYSGPNGLIAKKLGVTGHYSPALAPTITYKHLPVGKHTLIVYLANNNHTNVGVDQTIHFTVR